MAANPLRACTGLLEEGFMRDVEVETSADVLVFVVLGLVGEGDVEFKVVVLASEL